MEAIQQITTPLWAFMTDMFGELAPLVALGVGLLLVGIVALPFLIDTRPDPLDKLGKQARGEKETKSSEKAVRLRTDSPNQKLDKFATFLEPQDQTEFSAARLRMIQAGYRSRDAVRNFHFAQFALGIGLMTMGLLFALLTSDGAMNLTKLMLWIVLPGGAGYYLPKYWVERRRQERQGQIVSGFPDSLDLMLVCVEAGQSLDQAIVRVANEIRSGYPALADEFEMVAWEIKAGKDKITVLRDMSERCAVPDISSFVTVLVQSATFGTSIADALRVYASEMRDKRVMRAEEKANVLPTKLTLGTMMFTVPPLLIILIGPSVYDIMDAFGGSGSVGVGTP